MFSGTDALQPQSNVFMMSPGIPPEVAYTLTELSSLLWFDPNPAPDKQAATDESDDDDDSDKGSHALKDGTLPSHVDNRGLDPKP